MPTRMDNEWAKFNTDVDGNVRIGIQGRDFYHRISEGDEPGYSFIDQAGENQEVETTTDPEDIWDHGGLYTFSTTADIDRLSSSDDGDTQPIRIIGLDINWKEITQTITLTGQTPVAITPMIRVYDLRNMGSVDTAGDVYCFVNGATTDGVPDTPTDIRAMIRAANNRSLMAIYTVPADKNGYILSRWASISKPGGVVAVLATFSDRARLFGGVFDVQTRFSCMTTGNNFQERIYRPPRPVLPKTDIVLRAEVVSDTCFASGGFTIVLKDI